MPTQPRDLKIFLVGFMGAGKTALGRLLAERIGWEFADIDAIIEQREGMSIARIFAEKGESRFRALEASVLAEIDTRPGRWVVACGGGAFCHPANEALMRRSGITVWVDRPFERIWDERDELAPSRPLMRDEARLRSLYESRLPAYRRASVHLEAAEGDLPALLDALLGRLADHNVSLD